MADYTALDQALDQAIQAHLANGGTGPGGMTPEQIAAYYGTTAPKTGVIKELGKATGRGILGIPKLVTRAAQGGALDIGALLGKTPEQNAIAQTLGQAAEAIQGVQQNPTLAPNAQFAEQHPLANFVGENIEGALPWIAGAAASRIPVIGKAVLPAAATLSAQAEGTERQMKRGVEGNAALVQATPGALAEGALFAAMPKVMGKLKGVPAATEEGFTKGVLPGTLGKPGGILKGAVQGLAAEAPYLYGQSELKQAVDVASGAMTPEEWKQAHTPEAIAHALGTSAIGGIGFGALGGIGQKGAIEAKREEYRNLHQPIVDDKTPVDLNQKPVNTIPIQQEFPFETNTGPAKPSIQDILPEGEVVLPHAQALKVAAKLKKAGVTPIIQEMGVDITGNKVTRIALQEQPARELGQIPQQLSLNFGQDQTEPLPIIKSPATEEISKFEIAKPEEVADQFADMPEDLKAYIQDFMTNPKSDVEASALSQIIGIPEDVLLAKRIESLGLGKEESTLASGKPEQDELLAKRLGVKYSGNQEDADGNLWPMFTDSETGSTLMLKPGDDLASRLQEKRDLFKQTVAKVEPKSEPTIESPEEEKVTPKIGKAGKAAEVIGEAVGKEVTLPQIQTKMKRYAKATMGWEDTAFARDLWKHLTKEGKLSDKDIQNVWNANKDYYESEEGHTIGLGKDIARNQLDYQNRSIETLYKALQEGKIDAIPSKIYGDHFVTKSGTSIKDLSDWYQKNIFGKKKNKTQNITSSNTKISTNEGEGTPNHNVKITKADQARMAKVEAERAEETANAQRPHTIFKERMDAFNRELNRIDSEIAKLPKSAKKNILRREFNKAKERFKTLIKEGNFNKLKKEATPFYEQLNESLNVIKYLKEYPTEEAKERAIKNFKKSDEFKRFEAILDDLKSQARNIGRLELGEKLNEFREGVEEERKSPDLTGIEKTETAEDTQYRREREKKFLAEMSRGKLADNIRIENADDILDISNASDETRAAYEAKKTDKQKSLFLKNLANKAWEIRDSLDKRKAIIGVPEAGTKGGGLKEATGKRVVNEVKTAKELERETDTKLKADYEKQQENIRLLKEKKEAATQRQIERLQSERKGLETKEQAKTRLEKEAKEKIEAEKQKTAKERAEAQERKDIAKKLQRQPEEKPLEFNIKFNKKGDAVSKADKEYAKFADSKERVGSTSAIPKGAHEFVKHLANKFDLDKTFIVTESDLKNSNIKDMSITAKELYDEKGDYVGVLHSTADGVDLLALNDSRIVNEKTLINTLSHEVGHAIINKHFESASAETKQAIEGDFKNWLGRLAEKDNKAINELYQDSGKSWEDFKQDYTDMITEELASGGLKVNEEPMFHEYLAEQIAKYIKVTESTPKGILTRFFNALAEKLNYVFRFANKEFAKNHMPIQSVAKWLDGLKKQETNTLKKNASLKKKTKITYDDFKRAAKQVHSTFNPSNNESIVKNMTDLVDAKLADKGVIKQAYKGIFRLPWWVSEVRPAAENYEKSLESNVMLKQFLKATSHLDENVPGVVSLKDIENKYNKLPKTSREIINKLLVEGDKEGISWDSPKDIKSETLKNISTEDFAIYKQVRDFVNQAWRRDLQIQSDTLAYGLTKNVELQDKLGTAIRLKEIDTPTKLRGFLESQPSIKARGGLNTLITPQEFDIIADAIYSKDGIKDFYKEYSHDYRTESLPGYVPRERLDGAEWVVELYTKEGVKIFNQGFYTKAEAQRVFEDLKKNPEKYAPHNLKKLIVFTGTYPTKSSEYFSEESPLKEPVIRPVTNYERFNTGEDKLIADNVAKVLDKFENVPNKEAVIAAVRKEVMKHLLAQRGMQNRVQRSEQLIEGYDEDSPLDAIQTSLDRAAYRQAKMRYIIDQSRLISKTTDAQKKNAIREYVNKTLEPAVTGSKNVQMFKNMAAVYFMGFRPLTALMQLAQLHTVGAAELGMHLKSLGIPGSAQKLLAQAELDMRMGKISSIEKDIIKMAEERGVTWETSSQSFMFKDVDSITSKHFLGKRIVKLTDIALSMFQYMEKHNRQSAILAAYRVFSKGSSEFNQEAFDKAMEYNNNTNFMMNKGNVPYWAMRNPVGMSAYTLMSYTLNMANWMLNRSHGSLSDIHIDKWTQRQAFLKMLGYTAVLAGISGAPFAEDLNKLIRKIFGRDLHLETKTFIKQHAGEDIANLVADGVFAPLGVSVSSNVAVRVPFLSGLLDDQTIGESVSGAAGALVKKGSDAAYAAFTGQGRKFVEAASPEVIAGALRAERLYREGQRGPSGKPVYFEGKPVKSTGAEALMQGLFGIKSERRANIMNVTESEYKLTQYWNDKKKIAESKARRGDMSALQEFNRQLIKDKNARLLVKPIKLTPSKPNKERTGFEVAQ